MKSNRSTTQAPKIDNPLARLLVETLTQQYRDLEAGVAMYRAKKGPPEEAERLQDRARRMRAMFDTMKQQLAAPPSVG